MNFAWGHMVVLGGGGAVSYGRGTPARSTDVHISNRGRRLSEDDLFLYVCIIPLIKTPIEHIIVLSANTCIFECRSRKGGEGI